MRLTVGSLLVVALFTGSCGGGPPAAISSPRSQPSPSTAAIAHTIASPTPPDPCNSAPSDVAVALPLSAFGRVVGDWRNCQVFISSPRDNEIVVVDYAGNVIKTIPGEYGAGAMVIDGSTLYVALATSGSVDAIDTVSLVRTKTVATGLVKPRDLAFAGGRLWTTSGECAQWTMRLASIDPGTGKVSMFDADRTTNLGYCAGFATASKAGKWLVAWDSGLSPGNITVMDVSSGRPVIAFNQREEILGNLMDAAITPNGDKLVTASSSPYEFDEWNLEGVSRDGVVYSAGPYPDAVAISPVRSGLLATGVSRSTGASVAEFEVGKPAPVATMLDMGGASHNLLYPRGLAFSRDGALIFAITGVALDGSPTTVTLNILRGPTLP